jgi:hypothetical protein
MAGKQRVWPSRDELEALLARHTSWDSAAEELNVPRTTLNSHCRALKLAAPSKSEPVEMKSVAAKDQELGDVRKLIERRGLNPNDFELTNIRLNEWGKCSTCDTAQEQNRVDLKPRRDILFPARSDGWTPPKERKSRHVKGKTLTALMGDFHAPLHDKALLECAVAWTREHKPEHIIFMGDLMDYGSTLSRHKSTGFEASLQTNVDDAYGILRAFAQASPGTKLTSLDGNHEQRMTSALESRGLIPLAHLTQAEGGEPVLSSRHLLRLDELGVQCVDPPVKGYDYSYCETQVCDGLVARHGYLSKTGAGASVLEHVKKLSRSLAIGHCHRLAVVYHSTWPDDQHRQLIGIECGTMAEIRHGMGYATSAPDWQQGFAVIERHETGFTADLAPYIGGVLRWRNWSTA